MNEYTVEIQAASGGIWRAVHPAETVEADSAERAARDTAASQPVVGARDWRVLAWDGVDADTGTRPAAAWYGGESTLIAPDSDDCAGWCRRHGWICELDEGHEGEASCRHCPGGAGRRYAAVRAERRHEDRLAAEVETTPDID